MTGFKPALLSSVLAASLLTACEDPISRATDEDLILLLGERVSQVDGDRPLVISASTALCVKLIAGLSLVDTEVLPPEKRLVEAERCRDALRRSLTEPYRNAAALIFEDFRDVRLAERVINLAAERRNISYRDESNEALGRAPHHVTLRLEPTTELMEPVSK